MTGTKYCMENNVETYGMQILAMIEAEDINTKIRLLSLALIAVVRSSNRDNVIEPVAAQLVQKYHELTDGHPSPPNPRVH